MSKDLEQALASGALAPSTGAGVTIGIVDHGEKRVFAYGTAKPDSIFEIGSITKTFTGLLLSQMVQQGKVKFDEPVRELLPTGTVAKPAGSEITLLDLATQHSGLPRMPDNFHPADKTNPYADYQAANLYAFLASHGVAKPADAAFLYSNLGFGLLGQALADRAGIPYSELLQNEITGPLGMKDTVVALSTEQKLRFITGHDMAHQPAHAWDLDALAGAGAIRSTAADMLTYLEANLHPDQLPSTAAGTPDGKTLPAALAQSHELRADALPGMRIALAWLYVPATGSYWHNGGTGGYSSFAFFNPKADYGAVVLVNTAGEFADHLGRHIAERLAGKPAISLGPPNEHDAQTAASFAAGAAYFAKGDYDQAIHSFDEVLRFDPNASPALLTRGMANLYAGHYPEAQQDFSRNLQLDPTDPYRVIWLYLSRAKAGTNGKDELKTNAAALNLSNWPGAVILLYLGQSTPDDVLRAAANSDEKCEYNFYVGEYRELRGERPEARALFRNASDTCPKDFVEYIPSLIEVKNLEKTNK